jgi:ATP-dependent DNA helicase RecQ
MTTTLRCGGSARPSFADVTSFAAAAQNLTARLDAGEQPAALTNELAALRGAYRSLNPGQRAEAQPVVSALAARTKPAPATPATPAPSNAQTAFAGLGASSGSGLQAAFAGLAGAAEEEVEAQLALQGLAGLVDRAPDRFYDGAMDPDALLAYFGLPSFRPGQREAVAAALQGRDSMTVMSTGGGKSLCYQLPGLASDRLTIVVSPLIALMADQYRRLAEGGHPAVMLASGLAEDHNHQALDAIREGYARIVFCSPERFASKSFIDTLASREIALFVVDEAHCVSDWGHDFRPDYLRLTGVLDRLGNPPVMACTATATPAVAQEITARLRLRDPVVIQGGFDRPNLSFDVLPFDGKGSMERKFSALATIVGMPENRPAIVYAGTRKDVDTLTERLNGLGVTTVGYHAGMAADERASAQHRFLTQDASAIVATNAFGLGVDFPFGVRSVTHYAVPSSVEAYYQEAGRAGRDGQPARAVLLAMRADLGRLIGFNKRRSTTVETVVEYLKRLRRFATDGRLTMESPRDDDDRTALAVAERAGALTLAPAGGGRMEVALTGRLHREHAQEICQIAKDRGWEAYRSIERFASNQEACRRRQILDHFGDNRPGAPVGHCCDVCNPVDWLPALDAIPPAPPAPGSTKKTARKPVAVSAAEGGPLFEALKTWRKQAAGDKPAYTVANNATLAAIAQVKPSSNEELLAAKGVGPSFIAKYAVTVLGIVARHP